MTKHGQDQYNMPQSVRIWGKYDVLPSSWTLEDGMKKKKREHEENLKKDQETTIPVKHD